ncbi:MAG: histidinol-phosphatase [Sphaerochaetaceae bacterium]|nr:histidinol-phosphatase [Sphaerochaetaceae bacterium]
MPIFTQSEVNLHTHSFYCGHGTGEIGDFVSEALRLGNIKVLGFSEHCQTPDNFYPDRMRYETFETYTDVVNSFREGGYNAVPSLTVLLGAECDWNTQYTNYYRYLKEGAGFNYLIGSVHYFFDKEAQRLLYMGKCRDVKPYLSKYVEEYTQMLSSGLFLFGCHPDLYCYHTEWDKDMESAASEIIACAKENNMPLEVNGQGCLKKHIREDGSIRYPYPVPEFWAMAKEAGVKVCINSDAHNPIHLDTPRARAFASENGLDDLLVKWEITEGKVSLYQ